MIVAVSSSGDSVDSQLDPRFGRAPYFIIFNTKAPDASAIENTQNLNAAQGAGIQSAQNVAAAGAECLITGHCGPKAFKVLQAAGIKVYLADAATVKEAMRLFTIGKLKESDSADVEGHWV